MDEPNKNNNIPIYHRSFVKGFATVDSDHKKILSKLRWCIHKCGNRVYVRHTYKRSTIYLHKLVYNIEVEPACMNALKDYVDSNDEDRKAHITTIEEFLKDTPLLRFMDGNQMNCKSTNIIAPSEGVNISKGFNETDIDEEWNDPSMMTEEELNLMNKDDENES